MNVREIVPILEAIAPAQYAVMNDRIGLQVGDPDHEVRKILVTVDVTPSVISEAVRQSANLIVAHHPLIYNPLPNVRLDMYPQSLVYSLVRAGIALYVMHTNFDCADGGINDALADKLGVIDTKIMEPTYTDKLFKLVTFVPSEGLEDVREALADAGAGTIGDYTQCSFRSSGIGTFMPESGAEPYIGHSGVLENVPESRLEVLVPKSILPSVISAMIAAHPYQEPAYDVYPLWNKGSQWGLGRIGRLRTPMNFDGFCEMVRDALEIEEIRVSGNPDATIQKVALLGGSGGDKIPLANALGADVYVTGEIKHSQLLHAQALGLNVIDAAHFNTERPGMVALTPRLNDLLSSEGIDVEYVDDLTLLVHQ